MLRLIHMFAPSRHFADCEECGTAFDPVYGGACRTCGRLLCPDHFFGSRVQRLRSLVGLEVRCVDCRARGVR
ncbi:MAG TPA: hypothetical protein VMM18_11155 [Gemmatimonadaceae bacterium]|nr:hypothetical protein [Gemmatimonadaceae bacterium]